jgi:hypothetical protein
LPKHLDELISLVDSAWRLPQNHYAHLAQTVRFIGKIYHAAALAQRTKLHIMDDDTSRQRPFHKISSATTSSPNCWR